MKRTLPLSLNRASQGAFAFFGLILLAMVTTSSAVADHTTPPALAGWEGGVALSGLDPSYSSPAIADIDGNEVNGREVVIGGADGIVYAYRADGTLLWSAATPNSGCSGQRNQKLLSSPAVGSILGDGVPYVVIGYGGVGARDCDGGVAVYRGTDGFNLWNFSIKAFSKKQKFWAFRYSVVSTPSLADTDGDGKMEIGFGAFDRNIYLLNSDGKPRWYYIAADTVWSSPSFADADGDGKLEMIAATDISKNTRLKPPTPNGGYLYAFKTAKRKSLRIGFRDPTAYLWLRSFDQVLYSSPVIADVIPGNPGQEVIIASGCFFPQNTNNKKGKWLKVLSLKTGKLLRTLSTTACFSSSPAVADLDGDGQLEVVATVNGTTSLGGDGLGKVVAWKADNPTPIWTAIPRVHGDNDDWLGNFKSPVVADIDGNGSLEVLVSNSRGVAILNGQTGQHLTCEYGDCTNEFPLVLTPRVIQSGPAVGDLNLDGQLDLVVAGGSSLGSRGGIFAWTGFSGLLPGTAGNGTSFLAPWPMFKGNSRRTGLYGD